MNAASLQISAVQAAKATLRDGQHGSCVWHSSEEALKGAECGFLPSVPGVDCLHAEVCWGVRSESGVLARWWRLSRVPCQGRKGC